MKWFIPVAACAFVAWTTVADAETGFLDRSITMNGTTYRYQVYVPPDYVPSRQWPVVLFLHGAGRQGNDGTRQTNGGFPNDVRQHREWFPAIIVFAQAAEGTGWEDPPTENVALSELDRTVAEFAVDPQQTYLVGYSMGGAGTYRILYENPKRFTAAISVSGYVQPTPAIPAQAQEIDRKSHRFVGETDPFAALATMIKSVPLSIFHGDADETVPVEQSRKVYAALKATGADVRYTEMKGVGHAEAAEKAFADAAPMQWLLAQRRKAGTN